MFWFSGANRFDSLAHFSRQSYSCDGVHLPSQETPAPVADGLLGGLLRRSRNEVSSAPLGTVRFNTCADVATGTPVIQTEAAHAAGGDAGKIRAAIAAAKGRGKRAAKVAWEGRSGGAGVKGAAKFTAQLGAHAYLVRKGVNPSLTQFFLRDAGTYAAKARPLANGTALAFLGANVAGLAVGGVYYCGLKECRTGAPVTPENANEQLTELEADPTGYIDKHYENTILGIRQLNLGDALYNVTGHLLEQTGADGKLTFFRRVPQDMYDALKLAQQAKCVTSSSVVVNEPATDKSGKPINLSVNILPPYRDDPLKDAGVKFQLERSHGSTPGLRLLVDMGIGPEEGLRPHFDLELLLNDRYETPTQTTLRLGLPTRDQGFIAGVRQQSTRPWSGINISTGALDCNPSRAIDLSNPHAPLSGRELMLMNARSYLYLGDRNRLSIELSGGGKAEQANLSPSALNARTRETGYAELGIAGDFIKVTDQRGQTWGLNFYHEMQLYAPDLRGQVNFFREGMPVFEGSGLQDWPSFQLDTALQATVTDVPRLEPPLPILSAPIIGPSSVSGNGVKLKGSK